MDISIQEAAAQLGKPERQVRRMLQKGELPGRKESGRWIVDSDALPRTPGQQTSDQRLKHNIRAAVENGLGAEDDPRNARFSLFDLKAVQLVLPLRQQAIELLGAEHLATDALTATLDRLIRGCHRYAYEHKAEAYSDAREQACTALRRDHFLVTSC